MTHGVAGAMINADLITLGKSEWAHVYAPDRKPVAAIGNYLRENATALKNLAEYLTPGEISSLDELKPGQGAILRQGLNKIAAYRSANGELKLHSSSCTHIGCQLHFNSFEQTLGLPVPRLHLRRRWRAPERAGDLATAGRWGATEAG